MPSAAECLRSCSRCREKPTPQRRQPPCLRVVYCHLQFGANGFAHIPQACLRKTLWVQGYFGTEYLARNLSTFIVPVEVVAGLFFSLIAVVFVGLGQVMGRAFDQSPDRLLGYISNIGGSLAGIAAFALASYLRTPPVVWL